MRYFDIVQDPCSGRWFVCELDFLNPDVEEMEFSSYGEAMQWIEWVIGNDYMIFE